MIGERIKNLRKKANMNQTELGEKLGLSYGGISGIENNKNNPTAEILIKLSEVFNVSTDYLLMGKEKTNDLSKAEQEIINAVRKDTEIMNIFETIANAKKKLINIFSHPQHLPI